jgi:hypothetical protein
LIGVEGVALAGEVSQCKHKKYGEQRSDKSTDVHETFLSVIV